MIFNVVNKSVSISGVGTAINRDVLEGKTYYSDGLELVGTMPKINEEYVISNLDDKIVIPKGYHDGSEIAYIDEEKIANLVPENIKDGVTVFGVSGSYSADFDTSVVGDIILPVSAMTAYDEGVYSGTELEGSLYLDADCAYFVEYQFTTAKGRRNMSGILRSYDLGDGMVGLFSYQNEYTYPLINPNDEMYGLFFILQGGTMDAQGVITPDESKSGLYVKRDNLGTTMFLGRITKSDFGTRYQNKVVEVDQGKTVISYDKFIKQTSDPICPDEYVNSLMIDTDITPPKVLFDDFVELFYWRKNNGDYISYSCSYNEIEEGKGFDFIGCSEIILDAIYVNSDTMSLEEVQSVMQEFGFEIEKFGWQKDNITINAYIDGVDRQDIWGGFISRSNSYVYEKYDGLDTVTVHSKGVNLQECEVDIYENDKTIELEPDPCFAGFNKVTIHPCIIEPAGEVKVKVLSLGSKNADTYGYGYIIYFNLSAGKYVGSWVRNGGSLSVTVPTYSTIYVCSHCFSWKGPHLVGELNYIVNKMLYDDVEYAVNGLHATEDMWICLTPANAISEEPPEEYLPYNDHREEL